MLVPKGNPKNINNYQDVIDTGATLVTGAGFNTVEAAKKFGVPDSQMLLVEGEVGILAAMKAGRADVAVQTFFGAKEHEEKTGGVIIAGVNGSTQPDFEVDGLTIIVSVLGCTDSEACNFDADATENDGSCEYASESVHPQTLTIIVKPSTSKSGCVEPFTPAIITPPVFSSCSFAPKKV
jgi:hypothetical protein